MAIKAVHLNYLWSTPILHSCSCSLAKPRRVSCSLCANVYSSLPSLRQHVQRVHSSDVQKSDSRGSHMHSSEGCPQCFRWTVDLILQCEDAHPELLGKGFWILFHTTIYPFFSAIEKMSICLIKGIGRNILWIYFIVSFLSILCSESLVEKY